MVSEKGRAPVVTQLNYTALRRVATVAAHVISLSQKLRRQDKESSCYARVYQIRRMSYSFRNGPLCLKALTDCFEKRIGLLQ